MNRTLRTIRTPSPHLFHHNAIVVLGNGVTAKLGTISSKYEHFHEWKRLAEDQPGVVDMETLLKGVCSKESFMDIVENFILFDDSSGVDQKDTFPESPVFGSKQGCRGGEGTERIGRANSGFSGIPRERVKATPWHSLHEKYIESWEAILHS